MPESEPPQLPSSADAGRRPLEFEWTAGRFALLLAAIIAAAYPDVLSGLRTFYYRDFGSFGYPLALHHRQSIWRGEIPLWNPLNNCGIPFLAQWNTLVLYPLSCLYILLPVPWSLNFFCLSHLWLAGLGIYCLVRRWTGCGFAGAVAGIGFALTGLLMNSLMWPCIIAAFGWMPWTILLLERGWLEGGRWFVLGALSGAVQMLTGAPEIILLTWLLAGFLCLLSLVGSGEQRLPLTLRRLGRFALLILFVAGLSAVQLLPFLELLRHSQRDAGLAEAGLWSMPSWGWGNFFVPLFHCFASHHGVFFQPGQDWTSSYYPGIGLMVLAFAALFLCKDWRIWLLAALAFITVLMAAGPHAFFYPLVRKVFPGLTLMRYPVKFLALTLFIIPVLAGFGMSSILRLPRPAWGWARARLWQIGCIVLALIGLIVWLQLHYPLPDDDRSALISSAATRAFFVILMVSALLLASRQENYPAPLQRLVNHPAARGFLPQAIILILLALDPLTHAPRQNPTVPAWTLQPNILPQLLARPMQEVPRWGSSRCLVTPAALAVIRGASLPDPTADLVLKRRGQFNDFNLLDGLAKVDGFYPLFLREELEVRSLLYGSTNRFFPALMNFLSVSQTTDPKSVFDWVEREKFLPLVTAGQEPRFAGREETLRGLMEEEFDPAATIYLPRESDRAVQARRVRSAKILGTDLGYHRVKIDIDAPEPAMVVIAQTYYPAWKAKIDGAPVPLWKANHAFQAVQSPAGRHVIEIAYRDRAFRWGAMVSGGTFFGLGLFWVGKGRRPTAQGASKSS